MPELSLQRRQALQGTARTLPGCPPDAARMPTSSRSVEQPSSHTPQHGGNAARNQSPPARSDRAITHPFPTLLQKGRLVPRRPAVRLPRLLGLAHLGKGEEPPRLDLPTTRRAHGGQAVDVFPALEVQDARLVAAARLD